MRNFTVVQFIVFAGAGLIGLAVLYAAGLAFGLALAGAAMVAMLVLAGWVVVANTFRQRRGRGARQNAPSREP